ncbi:hypothetical protein GPECTOR_10g847 [Gonium pectorale]|uniref:Uncharacterized protein n=1 Tax=Gonium pectorale TaxID=33097 RepID=A0A150GQR3_GONPE|nr:hypothetical protein GPECTOR_10g847 [Gonium pectorale]|eukprot:KXZ52216.1 hypothetical protein GPECTOR_10g847 [Gonium pectorale]
MGGRVTPAPAGAFSRRRGLKGCESSDGAASGTEDVPSEQLEARMAAAADGDGEQRAGNPAEAAGPGEDELPPPDVSVELLAGALVFTLCDSALAAIHKGPLRVSVAALIGELLSSAKRASKERRVLRSLGQLADAAQPGMAGDPQRGHTGDQQAQTGTPFEDGLLWSVLKSIV